MLRPKAGDIVLAALIVGNRVDEAELQLVTHVSVHEEEVSLIRTINCNGREAYHLDEESLIVLPREKLLRLLEVAYVR